jgi:HSP20 family molecular chaperone IbpA
MNTETSSRTAGTRPETEQATLLPPVDVVEDAGGITLYADLPGVPRDKLALQIEADTLTIEGEMALAVPAGTESIHAEVNVPRYRRVFTLSRELDTNAINASLDKGVLTLRIPKAAHAQTRKVTVQVA